MVPECVGFDGPFYDWFGLVSLYVVGTTDDFVNSLGMCHIVHRLTQNCLGFNLTPHMTYSDFAMAIYGWNIEDDYGIAFCLLIF